MSEQRKNMKCSITKSRSGHYTATVTSDSCRRTLEKIGTLEGAREALAQLKRVHMELAGRVFGTRSTAETGTAYWVEREEEAIERVENAVTAAEYTVPLPAAGDASAEDEIEIARQTAYQKQSASYLTNEDDFGAGWYGALEWVNSRTDAPPSQAQAALPTNAEFEVAIETLRHVIECLRKNGSYADEEGEATDFLDPLLEAKPAAPHERKAEWRDAMHGLIEIVEARNSQGGGLRLNADGQRRLDTARALLSHALGASHEQR